MRKRSDKKKQPKQESKLIKKKSKKWKTFG